MGALIDNPITSVQLQLRGGWKTLLINSGVYGLIVFGAMGLWAEIDLKHLKDAAEGWTIFLMLTQTGLVLLFSIVRVTGAVRQDNSTGIMESHRLMPVTGLTACIGFIVGPIGQMVAIGIVTCIAGAISSSVAGIYPDRWLAFNAVLFVFMIFNCACAVLVGFYRRAVFNLFIVLVVIAFFSRGMLLFAVPGMAILISPLAGESIFNLRGANSLFGVGLMCAFLSQAMVGAVMLAAAARKFREPERPAFSLSLSLILLTTWIALNLMGILQWPAFEPAFLRYTFPTNDNRTQVQFTGSVLTAMLFSLLPIAAAIRADRQRHDEIMWRDARRPANRFSFSLGPATIALCALMACLLLLVPAAEINPSRRKTLAMVAISIVASVVSLGSLLSAYRSTARKTTLLVVAFLLFTWFGPLFADIIVHSVMTDSYAANLLPWSITAFGPIGTALSPWNPDFQTPAGISCQVGIAMVMLSIAAITVQMRRRSTSSTAADSSLVKIPVLQNVSEV